MFCCLKQSLTFLLLGLLVMNIASARETVISLNKGWSFREVGTEKWIPASVPGTVHTDLMRAGLIPDPFYGDNEQKLQWVSAKDWQYRLQFSLNSSDLSGKRSELVFEGLDTYAEVFLNGNKVLDADNMFRNWRIDAKPFLKSGSNELLIVFHNADARADSFAKAALPLVRPCENNRHYVRKAQYHFGWDWAPKLTTVGIWRNVYLKCGSDPVSDPDNWKKGLHKVALVQEPDSIGKSFWFKIDGHPVFMQGANWISADVFLPRVTKAKYRQLLCAAKDAHCNMLRVWGGGVYEDDAFYDLCDSLEIFVWQDFMFAGAMYPADAHFVENVRQEAIDNITRLRRHKCIVCWCGNNEIDEAWNNWGWQQQFHLSPADSQKLAADYRLLFEQLLPGLVQQYDGTRPYIPTSPMHGWGRKESMTEGDSHYWDVWWGGASIQKYAEKVPRFMSEYGMQAMPDWASICRFSKASDWDTLSPVMKTHQKHATGYRTLAAYLAQNGLKATSFREFAAATQELQARSLAVAITAHKNAAPRCMGTLFWQLNDCWPVTSWSVIDYYGRRKKAYYAVQRLYAKPVKGPVTTIPRH